MNDTIDIVNELPMYHKIVSTFKYVLTTLTTYPYTRANRARIGPSYTSARPPQGTFPSCGREL